MALCERFQGLDPIKLRSYQTHEVILLISRLTKYNKRNNPNKIKRKHAGDKWF